LTTSGSAAQAGRIARPAEVRVWDPAVRLFHWSLVAAFATAWLSETGATVHNTAGYVVLGLVAFRLAWGFVGGRQARFTAFVRPPSEVLRYLRMLARGKAARHLGHNPAGGAMIVALLAMVALTAASGWLSITDRFWGVAWVEELHEVAAYITLVLVGLHVVGVLVSSLLHGENLVLAMITGRKRID
jgi:cytochrome b